MEEDRECWQLLPKPPKIAKTTCYDRCIFCQTKNDVLRKAKPSSVEKVISALEVRQDEVSQRISSEDRLHREGDVLWHSSCFETYTSKQNLQYQTVQSSSDIEVQRRKRDTPFTWSKCIFCKHVTKKKDRQLINIATFEACNSIKESAEARKDCELLNVLESVNYDLIAAEGKYHKACHASYTSKVNLERKQRSSSAEENVFDEVFNWLMTIIP